ncbi:hypothetical protein BBUCA112A_H0021 (plasmid) [Borreliella burgdorferi CA-11.2A]|nr:hypothetical protein BBU64B_H0024 [Borreliella burgdorferi 64b]ACN55459.1 hypothetical protein BBUWI9123_H0027 [Borreliella burgdorferi WI91-23]ACN56228.1 hypothetical protein BBUCA112A_H0021 [Borreliella burgdorferi CA-11.2A]ACN92515.1 hypothetical protein BBU94A_H23 [Borreliella burgdorferi 94a]
MMPIIIQLILTDIRRALVVVKHLVLLPRERMPILTQKVDIYTL